MPTTTNVEKVKLNLMTTAQYTAATKDPNQLYMVTDAQISYNDLSNKPNLATVATTGSYNDLSNKPTIPTVYNAKLTIQKNGTTVKTFTANASSNVTCNITVPTNTNELTNGAGFITGITSSDVTTALGYTPYNSSNPNGYTSNVGTVTSVNNVSPVNGNVTLSIPSIDNLANKDLSNLSTTGNSKFQAPLVSGTNIKTVNSQSLLGSGNISIQADPAIDSKSITKNTSNQLQTVGVIDQNSTSTALKQWSGTKAQYDAIATKDANTLYNITDDSNTFQNVLETIYPVGSIYIGTMSVCPLSSLFGTWQKVGAGRVLQGSDSGHSAGSTIEAGLPNIEGKFLAGQPDGGGALPFSANSGYSASGALSITDLRDSNHQITETSGNFNNGGALGLDASRSSSIYGNSNTVQPPAFVVNIWQRTA